MALRPSHPSPQSAFASNRGCPAPLNNARARRKPAHYDSSRHGTEAILERLRDTRVDHVNMRARSQRATHGPLREKGDCSALIECVLGAQIVGAHRESELGHPALMRISVEDTAASRTPTVRARWSSTQRTIPTPRKTWRASAPGSSNRCCAESQRRGTERAS